MSTIFTRIIDGEIPGHFVWRDDIAVAFLSIAPLSPGHTLVVPRREIDHWIDADRDLRMHLFDVAHAVAAAQQRAFEPEKVGLMVAGLEVPHLHIHVSPINDVADLDFAKADGGVSQEALADAADRIRTELIGLGFAEAER